MGQFIPHAPLRGAAPQHHRQHKPQHAQRRKMPHSPSFLLTRRALLGTVPQQLRRIDGLEHTQTYLLAHLVTLLQVRYSIHIGFFLSACCMDLLSLQYVSKAPLLSALALLSSYLKCIAPCAGGPAQELLYQARLADTGLTLYCYHLHAPLPRAFIRRYERTELVLSL